jgi:hypothetical protein
MEHSMFTIGKCITAWQKSPTEEMLDEVVMGAEAFYEIAKELRRRA